MCRSALLIDKILFPENYNWKNYWHLLTTRTFINSRLYQISKSRSVSRWQSVANCAETEPDFWLFTDNFFLNFRIIYFRFLKMLGGGRVVVSQVRCSSGRLKELGVRLRSIKNIEKITKTMKMISSAKFAKVFYLIISNLI